MVQRRPPLQVVTTLTGHPGTLSLSESPDRKMTLRFEAEPGLYQFSGVIDAQDFDWESLYTDLHDYGNSGQRTGPWDFQLGSSKALVPSYWVKVDGHAVGLWYFQRISLADLAGRRFRGRFAFQLEAPGEHVLALAPCNYPEAENWLMFLLPRLQRCADAMPRDGYVPPSSHRSVYLYVEEMSVFRWTLLTLGGPDVYDWGPFTQIPGFLWQVLRRQDREQLSDIDTGIVLLSGGLVFFSQMAAEFADPRAARLFDLLLAKPPQPHHNRNVGAQHHHSRLWSFLAADPPPVSSGAVAVTWQA